MRPIATDGVAWSVCLSVCLSVCRSVCHHREPCKTAELIEMPFGLRTRVGQRKLYEMGVPIPMGRGILRGKKEARWKV